jgi:hypothetical protein
MAEFARKWKVKQLNGCLFVEQLREIAACYLYYGNLKAPYFRQIAGPY